MKLIAVWQYFLFRALSDESYTSYNQHFEAEESFF